MMNNGVTNIVIANRTYETGCNLAREFNGRAIKFETYLDELPIWTSSFAQQAHRNMSC